jgi:hypothetical protein
MTLYITEYARVARDSPQNALSCGSEPSVTHTMNCAPHGRPAAAPRADDLVCLVVRLRCQMVAVAARRQVAWRTSRSGARGDRR